MASDQLRRLIKDREYAALKSWLQGCDFESLAENWSEFKPLEKLVCFKLLEPARALEFYTGLDLNGKYFLLCAFELNSIAPILEPLPPRQRALFVKLPAAYYDRMLHQMCREQVEIEVAVGTN